MLQNPFPLSIKFLSYLPNIPLSYLLEVCNGLINVSNSFLTSLWETNWGFCCFGFFFHLFFLWISLIFFKSWYRQLLLITFWISTIFIKVQQWMKSCNTQVLFKTCFKIWKTEKLSFSFNHYYTRMCKFNINLLLSTFLWVLLPGNISLYGFGSIQ